MHAKNAGFFQYLLLNMAILGIHVSFRGCSLKTELQRREFPTSQNAHPTFFEDDLRWTKAAESRPDTPVF